MSADLTHAHGIERLQPVALGHRSRQLHGLSPRAAAGRGRLLAAAHRPEGGPRFHVPRHGRAGALARRHDRGNAGPGGRQDRAQAAGDAGSRIPPLLHAARLRQHLRQPEGLGARRGRQGRLLSGAQEDRRHSPDAARGRDRPVLQRRVRRHLHLALCRYRPGLQLSGAQDLRQERARHPAARSRRRQGRPPGAAGGAHLHRGVVRGTGRARPLRARHPGGARRPECDGPRRPDRDERALGAHRRAGRAQVGRGHSRAAAARRAADLPARRHRRASGGASRTPRPPRPAIRAGRRCCSAPPWRPAPTSPRSAPRSSGP